MTFPFNKRFIYNFTSMTAIAEDAHDCTLTLPPIPYMGCKYYNVECIGFNINYDTIKKRKLDHKDAPIMGLVADGLTEESNFNDGEKDQYLICKIFPFIEEAKPVGNNRFKVRYSGGKRIRFRLFDLENKPYKCIVDDVGYIIWTLSLEFSPSCEGEDEESEDEESEDEESEDKKSEDEKSEDKREEMNKIFKRVAFEILAKHDNTVKKSVNG